MRLSCPTSPLRTLVFTTLFYLSAPSPAHAQAPYLFASFPGGATSQIASYSIASDGTLVPIQDSPFNVSGEGGFLTTDPSDQFLFVLNAHSNTISVMSIDASGALTEVGSPIPAPQLNGSAAPSEPTCMATFDGKGVSPSYLFVGYRSGAIAGYQIGTTSPPLTAVSITPAGTAPVDMAISPQGFMYVALQSNSSSAFEALPPGLGILSIDPASSQLTQVESANNEQDDSVALNPTATVLFDGEGSSEAGFLESAQIPSNSAIPLAPQSLPTNSSDSPASTLLVAGSGQLLYVRQGAQTAVYTIDKDTGVLAVPSGSTVTVPFDLNRGTTVAHPALPYLYNLQNGQIHIFEIIDLTSGALQELTSSPVTIAEGAGSAGIVLTHNAMNQSAPQYGAHLFPAAINFSSPVTVGQSALNSSALFTSSGTNALTVTVTVTGANPGDFSATPCLSPVAAGSPCTITVTFQPTQAGPRAATLSVAYSGADAPQTLQLTGYGLSAEPTVSLTPSTLTFAATSLSTAAPSQSVVVTNAGNANLHISSIVVSGQNVADFAITNSPSPSALPTACAAAAYSPGASCSITVVFVPFAAGARSALITITDDAPGSPQAVQLGGTGLASGSGGTSGTGNPTPTGPPAITVSASSLVFISTAVHPPTTEQYVTITNSGASGSSLIITSVALTGTNSADFELTNGCKTPVSPQTQGCILGVTFTPSGSGPRTASLILTDNAAPSTQTITLTGSIQNQTQVVSISPDPSGQGQSATVSPGQTATYKLQVVSTFNGTISFLPCVGAPSTATCTVPGPITLQANQSALSFSITVAVAAASSSTRFDERPHPLAPLPVAFLSLLVYCALVLWFAYALKARHSRPSPFPPHTYPSLSRLPAVAAVLVLSLLAVAGCGGASTVATAPITATPASDSQTYTITVQPIATPSDNLPGPSVQPITLTLVVD